MILWKRCFDPFITVVPVSSSAFLPIVFSPPNCPLSIHICVYLPTAGKEWEFVDALSQMILCIDELKEKHPEAVFYIRGDFNASSGNLNRSSLLQKFSSDLLLRSVDIPHKTYHHFTGDGIFDSDLDQLFFSSSAIFPEMLCEVICKLNNPLIESHHDLLVSAWKLPTTGSASQPTKNIKAPRISMKRTKILWSESGIESYQKLVQPHFTRLQTLWLDSPSKSSITLLLQSTNNLLSHCASFTNKSVDLSKPFNTRSRPIPSKVKRSQSAILGKSKKLRNSIQLKSPPNVIQGLQDSLQRAKADHRRLVRSIHAKEAQIRDENLCNIDSNPSLIHKVLRRGKTASSSVNIQKLKVGDKVYLGDQVPDGFLIVSLNLKVLTSTNSEQVFKISRMSIPTSWKSVSLDSPSQKYLK